MARTTALTSISTNTKKRKSTGSIDKDAGHESKRPRNTLDAFFSPVATKSLTNDKGAKDTVTLNDEQKEVLRMVVDEGKSVFFTGAAGELQLYICVVASETRRLLVARHC